MKTSARGSAKNVAEGLGNKFYSEAGDSRRWVLSVVQKVGISIIGISSMSRRLRRSWSAVTRHAA